MSIWNKKEIKREIQELNKDIKTDILIIGAGITGMTTAYFLKDNDICIVDANKIGHGVTLNTTAKINYFQERIYTKISTIRNKEIATKYLKSQLETIKNIKEIIKKENIDCDLKRVDSYVFANTLSEVEPLKKEIEFLKENNIEVNDKKLPSKITQYSSYCVSDTYIFNPIKYLNGIYNVLKENDINIYENTKIIKIEKLNNYYICHTNKYSIKTKKVVLACHYPYFVLPLLLPLKSHIEKSYMVISKVKVDGEFTCISSSSPTYSTRFYQDGDNIYQICLAESHNTSVKQNDSYHFQRVKEIFKLKDSDIVMTYSNVDIMTPDHMPYIGILKENMYIACGYNTWGMTNGVLASKIISDMILNKENEYAEVFNPNRINLSNLISLPSIILGQIKSFLGPKLNKNKSWYSNKVSFINKNGKNLAIYKDENGFKHIIHNKCPHFGCSLIFNEEEKTWDCPCHSSRFDIDGKCIKGPSNYDISYKE
ncbi:MAG: FAD-dependent oxidoreductase [Bacilli bacterium]|nr:FAD-dependent oxidoreductase [Bacilli bacterium]